MFCVYLACCGSHVKSNGFLDNFHCHFLSVSWLTGSSIVVVSLRVTFPNLTLIEIGVCC